MKRVVNDRPMCFFLAAQTVGLVAANFAVGIFWLRSVLLCAAVATFVALWFAKKKIIYLPIAFAVGFLCFSASYDIYALRRIDVNSDSVEGTVSSEIIDDGGKLIFYLCDVSVDGQRLSGGARAELSGDFGFHSGDRVELTAHIKSMPFDMSDGWFVSRYHKRIYYDVRATDCVVRGKGSLNVFRNAPLELKRKLYDTVDETTGDTAIALLLGDKTSINDGFYDDVKASGIAHIFAVSGLHIGIFAYALYAVFKKIKINPYVKTAVISSALVIYGAFCGFPASVVRAIVMSVVFMLAAYSGRQSDALSALSFAGIIVFLIYPTDIFSVGCLLSFAAVAGIVFLQKPVEDRLKFLPKGVSSIISVSLAVSVFTYAITAHFFGEYQTMFVLSNLILMPILPFIYLFLLIICALVQIIPAFSGLLILLRGVLLPVKLVSFTIGSFAFAVADGRSFGVFTAAYYFLLILYSRYVFLTYKTKNYITLAVFALAAVSTSIFAFC